MSVAYFRPEVTDLLSELLCDDLPPSFLLSAHDEKHNGIKVSLLPGSNLNLVSLKNELL